jgi:pimeloyl-ACP methyl ester carboxylesterase
MPIPNWSPPTRRPMPIILIRGFGGLEVEDDKQLAYQGFNVGSVYPQKRGENYIYEGFILRLMKSRWQYHDATNVVGYYDSEVSASQELPAELDGLEPGFFKGNKVVIDPAMALQLMREPADRLRKSLWVFRYYDLGDRKLELYGEALVRLIGFIRALILHKERGEPPKVTKVNLIAHSMGGLIVREALQRAFPKRAADAADRAVNKIVTLGTPHRGITFQIIEAFKWLPLDAGKELWAFNPEWQQDLTNAVSYLRFKEHFPLDRLLTVVGTNYRTYGVRASSWLNRLFSVGGEFGPNYNRSDGLVQQTFAQIDGAPRTFVHKCHGGFDSLVTARESFEIAMRFFKGNVRVRLRLLSAEIGAAATSSARASTSSVSRSSRAASISSCSTRAKRRRTATAHSPRRT